jgi:DeoR/GlpR family transcriptional regulator of sugar metabolism
MPLEVRKKTILDLLAERSFVETRALAQALGVSELTVRRDLDALDRQGLLKRVRGGAVSAGYNELPFNDRADQYAEEKARIAEKAASHIEDGDCVLLEAGTTVSAMLPAVVKKRNLRVVTHAINIAATLLRYPDIHLTMIGGSVRPASWATVGTMAEEAVQDLNFEKLFLSCDGVTVEHGLTAYDESEARLNRRMIERAAQCYLLADHGKFGRNALHHIVPLHQVQVIITDSGIAPEVLESIRVKGNEIVVV